MALLGLYGDTALLWLQGEAPLLNLDVVTFACLRPLVTGSVCFLFQICQL